MLRHFTTPLLLTLAVSLASCSLVPLKKAGATPTSTASSAATLPAGSSILKLAQVETVRATVSLTQPPEAIVVISGLLNDGATRVQEVQQQRLSDGFVLTVITTRPAGAMASLALIPYERTVSLNLQGMPKGPCRIVANGVATSVIVP